MPNLDSKKISINSCILSILIPFIIIFLYSSFHGNDNTNTLYTEGLSLPSYYQGQFSNYRYISAAIGYIIHHFGISYFDLLPFWVFLFATSIYLSSQQIVLFLGLSEDLIPFVTLSVASSAFFTDLYLFALTYSVYGIALMGVALALWACRKLPVVAAALTTTFCSLLILTSYQPLVLVLPFAGALKLLKSSLDNRFGLKEAVLPVAGFVLSTFIYLSLIKLIGPENGRSVSSENVLKNLPSYIDTSIKLIIEGNRHFNMRIQALIYLGAMVLAFVALTIAIVRRPNLQNALALLSFISALAIYACPFALWGEFVWIDARMMASSIFFVSGCMAILFQMSPLPMRKPLKFVGLIFIVYSLYLQISYNSFAKGQDERDRFAVELITKEISRITTVTPNTKLAVMSTWQSGITSDERISAFNSDWSRTEIFRVITGNFVVRPVPEKACLEPLGLSSWRVEIVDDVVVVCMR